MNLITCSENCAHQKEGYCNLENSMLISSAERKCCFFQQRKNPAQTDRMDSPESPGIM